MTILDELKAKANGKADAANNIQEAVSMMEFGGGSGGTGGVMVINDTDGTLDKTWQEIYDAMSAGKMCAVSQTLEGGIETSIVKSAAFIAPAGKYKVLAGDTLYVASSPTEYPGPDL